eukprot:4257307-Amphidinium_carterae.1
MLSYKRHPRLPQEKLTACHPTCVASASCGSSVLPHQNFSQQYHSDNSNSRKPDQSIPVLWQTINTHLQLAADLLEHHSDI